MDVPDQKSITEEKSKRSGWKKVKLVLYAIIIIGIFLFVPAVVWGGENASIILIAILGLVLLGIATLLIGNIVEAIKNVNSKVGGQGLKKHYGNLLYWLLVTGESIAVIVGFCDRITPNCNQVFPTFLQGFFHPFPYPNLPLNTPNCQFPMAPIYTLIISPLFFIGTDILAMTLFIGLVYFLITHFERKPAAKSWG